MFVCLHRATRPVIRHRTNQLRLLDSNRAAGALPACRHTRQTKNNMKKRHRRVARRARCSLLLSALVLVAAAGPRYRSSVWAAVCSTASTAATSLRVDSLAAARELNTAVNCTGGGQLNAVWAGTVVLDASISIGAGTFLSITGEDELAEVQGGELSTRLFDVSAGGGLYLTRLRLLGGTAENGGAVYSSMASLTLDSCRFERNSARNGGGGAVWAEGGEVTIAAGEFVGNSASLGVGGAVHATGTILTVRNGTRFEDNKSAQGGALYCGGDGLVESTVDNATTANDTTVTAAAVSCSLRNATFVANIASPDTDMIDSTQYVGGAAMFDNVDDVHITDCLFAENWGQTSAGALYGGGNGTALLIDRCTFRNNTSPSQGGAIAASAAILGGGTELRYNFAGNHGGAVSVCSRWG